MKIRTDFVTNSSSSSFVAINIENPLLIELLEPHSELFDERFVIEGDKLTATDEEAAWVEGEPSNLSEAITLLIETIATYFEEIDVDEDEAEQLLNKMYERTEELGEATESIDWQYFSSGYGGDDDTRYSREYSEEEKESWYEYIAQQKQCDVEDVTEDDFERLIECSSGHNESGSYTYSKELGETHDHDFDLIVDDETF